MSTIRTFMIGLVSGTIIGVLFAPAKGSKTRKRLSRMSTDANDAVEEFVDNVKDKLTDATNQMDAIVEKGKAKMNAAQKEMSTAKHDGIGTKHEAK